MLNKYTRNLFIVALLIVFATPKWSWGQTTVTYTISSTTSVTKSGTSPSGSSASYSQTYATVNQMTNGNSCTLTLSGYTGYKITSIVLNMKSNTSSGSGNMTTVAGSTTISSIATGTFASTQWNGAYSTTYVNITKTPTAYTIGSGENVVITINATANSLFINSYSITYQPTAPLAPNITSIAPGNNQLSVNFTAPSSDGGSAITNYKYSTDGGATFTSCSPAQTTSPINITGLTNGTSYNVQIRAVNAVGDGTATASTAATPSAAGAPSLSISGTTSFGSTCTNSNGQQTFTITNNGTAQADGVSVGSSDPQFVVSGLSSTSIAVSGTATYTVTFTPSSAGSKTATITVSSTTSGANSPTSSLTGTGVAPVTSTVTNSAATSVTTTTATLNANLTTLGVCPATTEKGFVYSATGTNNNPLVGGTNVIKTAVSGTTTGAYTLALTGLTSGTQYSVNAYSFNGTTYVYGTANTFTTTITAPSAVAVSSKTATSITIGFTNGSGSNRLIVARLGSTTATAPVNGTGYTVNSSSFSDGLNATTATGNVVVYSGSASTATITGLSSETAYSFDVYEFNGSGATAIYSTAASTTNQRTLSAAPTTQATLSSSASSYNQIDLTVNTAAFPASGATRAGYLVIYGTGTVTFGASNGNAPTASSGTIFSTSTTILPTTPATTINVTGLNPATTYNFLVIPYTWDGTNASTYNYLTSSAPTSSATTNNGPTIDVSGAGGPISFATKVGGIGTPTGSYSYPLAASSLVSDVVVTAPTNFEVSKDDATYSSSVTYFKSGTSLPVNSFVYVRFNPSTINGTNSGNISHTSTGAATQNVSISAKIIAVEPTSAASNVTFTNVTGTTLTINWTNGGGSNRIVLVKSGSAVDASPSDETTYTANTVFGSGTQVGTGNYVVFNGTGTSVNVTGLTVNTTYHVAVFEYNIGTVNGTENYFSTSATGNQTCINPTYYSQGNGDPATLSNWNTNRLGGGSAPSNLTTVGTYVIQNGHNLTTTAAVSFGATGSKLQIENGGTLTANHAITIASLATFQIDNGGTYKQNSAIAMASTIFNGTEIFGSSSNFEITVNPSGTSTPSSPGYGNLTINITSGSSNFGWGSNITQVQGNLLILGTGTGTTRHALASTSSQSLSVGGNLTISGGNFWLSSGTAAVTVNLSGNLVINGGTLDIANSSGVGIINVGGDVTITSGTLTEGGSTTTSKIVFNKSGTQNFTGGATISNTVNFEISSGSSLNLGTEILSGAGAVTLNSGGTLRLGSTNTAGAITGNITATGTLTLNSGSTVEYNGSGIQYVSAGRTLPNFVVNNASGVSLLGALTIQNSLTVNSSASLDASTYVISFNSGATGTINGTIKTANANGLTGSTTTTFSNTNNPSITFGSSSTIEYNAAGAQTVTANAAFQNLRISGSGTKTLAGASTVNKTLTLAGGTLDAAFNLTLAQPHLH